MAKTQQRPHLVLASGSPRRKSLLNQIGIKPDQILATDIDESVLKQEVPQDYVKRMAKEKAQQCQNLLGEKFSVQTKPVVILAADTIVAVGRRILGKPIDDVEARKFLSLMSGRAHQVMTGIYILPNSGPPKKRFVRSRIKFKRLSASELTDYIARREWEGKSGAYAIQGYAERFVLSISGSYSNVVGLPLFETANLLESCSIQPSAASTTNDKKKTMRDSVS